LGLSGSSVVVVEVVAATNSVDFKDAPTIAVKTGEELSRSLPSTTNSGWVPVPNKALFFLCPDGGDTNNGPSNSKRFSVRNSG